MLQSMGGSQRVKHDIVTEQLLRSFNGLEPGGPELTMRK